MRKCVLMKKTTRIQHRNLEHFLCRQNRKNTFSRHFTQFCEYFSIAFLCSEWVFFGDFSISTWNELRFFIWLTGNQMAKRECKRVFGFAINKITAVIFVKRQFLIRNIYLTKIYIVSSLCAVNVLIEIDFNRF